MNDFLIRARLEILPQGPTQVLFERIRILGSLEMSPPILLVQDIAENDPNKNRQVRSTELHDSGWRSSEDEACACLADKIEANILKAHRFCMESQRDLETVRNHGKPVSEHWHPSSMPICGQIARTQEGSQEAWGVGMKVDDGIRVILGHSERNGGAPHATVTMVPSGPDPQSKQIGRDQPVVSLRFTDPKDSLKLAMVFQEVGEKLAELRLQHERRQQTMQGLIVVPASGEVPSELATLPGTERQ